MFEKIKLIATDMDGTLLNNAKEMPSDFIPWVRSHPQIKMVIASGRQYYTLKRDFEEITDRLIYISDNGGLAVYKDEIIYSDLMTQEDVRACLDAILTIPDSVPFVCGLDCAYMPPAGEEGCLQGRTYYARLQECRDLYAASAKDQIIKLAIYFPGFRAEEVYNSFPKLPDSLLAVLSGDSWIDIANRTVHKGAALAAIQKKYALEKDECMAFGDYPNDLSMLAVCEESFCMANGYESVREIAKHIAPSNEEEGVMQVLRSF
ncbi:MAG: HAD family hydrolase [Lachnospiraceae bacterium]|nr:HAD family hydrolase [Lachnospiraceae bacterium]